MNTIQSGMLIALGFLAASLIGLLVVPALWSRAVRLTTRRITQTVPLTAMEIEADRDKVRAEYAIKMHKLESLVEQVKLSGARQQIEINRRDARVNVLEAELEQLTAAYEEAQNARRVLEQTIAERLPRVEGRLSEAQKLLGAREREIGELTATSRRQVHTLSDVARHHQDHLAELDQIAKALGERAPGDEGKRRERDVGLRKAFDGLRAKFRTGADQFLRVQPSGGSSDVRPERVASLNEGRGDGLRGELVEAPLADGERAIFERQIRQLRARADQHVAEMARLKAELAAASESGAGGARGRGSRQALAAKVAELDAERTTQSDTIEGLRDEVMELRGRVSLSESVHIGAVVEPDAQLGATGLGGRLTLAERVQQAQSEHDGVTGVEAGSSQSRLAELNAEGPPRAGEAAPEIVPIAETKPQSAPKPRVRLADRIANLSRSSG